MRITIPAVLALCLAACAPALAQPRPEYLRGEQLYEAKCNGCHNQQVHWRANKLATDWSKLKIQVRRWQENANLGWSEDDIIAVAQYLNLRFYFYPVSPDRALFGRGQAVATGAAPAPRRQDRCSVVTRLVSPRLRAGPAPDPVLRDATRTINRESYPHVSVDIASRPVARGVLQC